MLSETIPFPKQRYDVILADPPWPYDLVGGNFDSQFTKTKKDFDKQFERNGDSFASVKSAKDHYNVMTLEAIKQLPVKDISESNSICYMWITGPHLPYGAEVLKAWGFTYSTVAFVWYKEKTNPGFYTMSSVEYCLVGKRGSIPKPRGSRNELQFLAEERTYHSAKPEEIRKRITRMHPTQKRIELFARVKVNKWDHWGNQLEGNTLPGVPYIESPILFK